jgi:hypothetical protein
VGGIAGGIGAWSVGTLGGVPTWLIGLPAGGLTGGLAATLVFRRTGVLMGTFAGALAGAGAGAIIGGRVTVTGLLVMTIVGVAYGSGYGFLTGLKYAASAWFTLSRCWFAACGSLPWQLAAFLKDAHRRGILRQMGGVYQFRHMRLQDHLAGPPRR